MDFLACMEHVAHNYEINDLLLHFLMILHPDFVHPVELNYQRLIELFQMFIVRLDHRLEELELALVNRLQCEPTICSVIEERAALPSGSQLLQRRKVALKQRRKQPLRSNAA